MTVGSNDEFGMDKMVQNLHNRGWVKLRDLPDWEIFQMVEEFHKEHGTYDKIYLSIHFRIHAAS